MELTIPIFSIFFTAGQFFGLLGSEGPSQVTSVSEGESLASSVWLELSWRKSPGLGTGIAPGAKAISSVPISSICVTIMKRCFSKEKVEVEVEVKEEAEAEAEAEVEVEVNIEVEAEVNVEVEVEKKSPAREESNSQNSLEEYSLPQEE